MRWLALVLVLVNLAVLGWLFVGAPGQAETGIERPPEIGHLALLRETTEPAAVDTSVCYTIGPFADSDLAAEARARLAALDLDPEERVLRDDEVYGYQVLLPPFDSQAEAVEVTRELAERGIRDYFVMVEEGEFENAVSLGLFSEQRFAVNHLRTLEDLGFDAEMRLRTRTRERYWQDYRDPDGRVTDELLVRLSGEQPVQRLERECD